MFETMGASGGVGVVETRPLLKVPPAGAASLTFGEALAHVRVAVAAAASFATPAHRLGNHEIAPGLGDLGRVHADVERLTLTVLAEGLARGLHTDAGLSAFDWLAARCPWLSRAQVADLVTVATGLDAPGHQRLADAVAAGAVPVRRAARVLRALARVKPALDPDGYDQALGTLLDVAGSPRFTDGDLKRVTDHLASVALSEKDHHARDVAARDLRGVHESSLADGSLVRFIVTCDPEGAAALRSVMASPLAAPAPDETGPDPRSGTQRRYDALLTIIRRGLAGSQDIPACPKAAVVITIAYDTLTQRLSGTGTSATGDVLSPGTVRRLACDADLVPMVLGTDRELLDLGRARRLVTPGQRRALHHRDQGCTFPGCSTPAPWCDAHHVIHWSRGGSSDLTNYALLCGRHHALVHERDHTATVSAHGVTWHL